MFNYVPNAMARVNVSQLYMYWCECTESVCSVLCDSFAGSVHDTVLTMKEERELCILKLSMKLYIQSYGMICDTDMAVNGSR